jgi:hypothetical protein
MDKTEARSILIGDLNPFREKPYAELIKMVDAEPVTYEKKGPSGVEYQIEIQAFYDGKEGGSIRVAGCIDDKGWRAFSPLTEDFIKPLTTLSLMSDKRRVWGSDLCVGY